MQVCGIYIAIGKNGVFGKNGKTCHKTCFACAAFTADDDNFFHAASLILCSKFTKRFLYSGKASIIGMPLA